MNFEYVGLITGSRWHLNHIIFKKIKKKVIIFDDSDNFYIKPYLDKNDSIKKTSQINKIKKKLKSNIFWSPINDYGSVIADRQNFIHQNIIFVPF